MAQHKCFLCDEQKEMKFHNVTYNTLRAIYYYCDDCLLIKMKKQILDAMKGCAHLISIDSLEKVLINMGAEIS